ncbi:hypothetical protein SDC9_96328 [bioreactor metagenome]|uniref:Uncharacterized protein n=1 Tax=bioreactor metagenome TaxID=1076179 RepID=A0A645AA72_9ZZZZ
MVAHHQRTVDGNGARGRLGDGDKVEHLLIVDPAQFHHHLLAHEADDHKAATESEQTETEGGPKELQMEPKGLLRFLFLLPHQPLFHAFPLHLSLPWEGLSCKYPNL